MTLDLRKKRDRSASPVSKTSTQKQGHSSSPPADTSSGLESAYQPALFKGDSGQPSSGPDRLATGPPTGHLPLFHNQTRNRPLPVLVLI